MFEDIHDPSARVRAVCQYGCQVEVDPSIPPKRYFRSGLEMIRMANVYCDEGDLESAFVLYSKYIALFIEKLPKHPDYKSSTAHEISVNKEKVKKIFPLAEILKKKLKEKYAKQEEKRQEQEKLLEEQRVAEEAKRLHEQEKQRQIQQLSELEDAQRRQTREEQQLWEQERHLEYLKEQERQKLEEERRRQVNGEDIVAGIGGVAIATTIPTCPDIPPPDYGQVFPDRLKPGVPSRDLKPSTPEVDRSSKPSHFTATGSTTQNRYNLRDVIVPAAIVSEFLNIAGPNTNKNIETCGILCGQVSQNAFRIKSLLIPRQSGTSDTCTTEGEEDIFNYQDTNNLITLGWIHTHPSQTAFLSSVDLHTHCSYQQLLPEAIAIVCAPSYQETGYFSLTPNHGLSLISGCRQRGFHDHPKHPPLFEEAGHVKIDPSSPVSVLDLRR